MNLLKYKEEQEMAVGENRMSLVEGIATIGWPPRQGYLPALPWLRSLSTKESWIDLEQRTTKRQAIKTRPFMLPSPIYRQSFLLLALSSL